MSVPIEFTLFAFCLGAAIAFWWSSRALKRDFAYPVMNWVCGAQGIGARVSVSALTLRVKLPEQEVCVLSLEPYLRIMVQEAYHDHGKVEAIKVARQAFRDLRSSKAYVETVCE